MDSARPQSVREQSEGVLRGWGRFCKASSPLVFSRHAGFSQDTHKGWVLVFRKKILYGPIHCSRALGNPEKSLQRHFNPWGTEARRGWASPTEERRSESKKRHRRDHVAERRNKQLLLLATEKIILIMKQHHERQQL